MTLDTKVIRSFAANRKTLLFIVVAASGSGLQAGKILLLNEELAIKKEGGFRGL